MFLFDLTFDFKDHVYKIDHLDDLIDIGLKERYGIRLNDTSTENIMVRKIGWDRVFYMTPNQLQLTLLSQIKSYFEINRNILDVVCSSVCCPSCRVYLPRH